MAEPVVPLGEIVATHGLKGWLKLNPFNPATTTLSSGAQVVVDKAGSQSAHEVEASSPHKHQLLVKLRDLNGIDDAERFVGSTLSVAESALEALAPGQYYHYQVIGFDVFAVTGERIGTILSTLSTPGGELYVVQGTAREYLIPAVKEIIEKVDFDTGTVIVNPPPGLLDL
ncbi:MAG TPA: ribosome maturation factor RimM [Candidatus Binatia bacterium]